ncbi:MAG: hypothetical protein ACK5IQ_03735 [Bacteroidales bacterium]
MESVKVNILNPKAKLLLKNLADLNLIVIEESEETKEFVGLLNKLRKHSDDALSLDEIASEVEEERKLRNGC